MFAHAATVLLLAASGADCAVETASSPLADVAAVTATTGTGVEGALRASLDSNKVPDGFTLVYDDMDSLHGGTRIEVKADGTAVRKDKRQGRTTETKVKLDPAALTELVGKLVDIEVWKAEAGGAAPVPGATTATLSVGVRGAEARLSEPYNDLDARDRIVRVKERLDALVPRKN